MFDDFLEDLREAATRRCEECRHIETRQVVDYPEDDPLRDPGAVNVPKNEFCSNCGRLFETVHLRVVYD